MGKRRIIAETGAGQHGVATATVCALFGLDCVVYMGEEDMRRQRLNVFRMRLLGANVVGVTNGSRTLKDAISEAMRDWVTNVADTHYLLGSALGAHPYPMMVRDFHKRDRRRSARQMLEAEGRLPDAIFACVGGGSNAIGIFHPFLNDEAVKLIGIEAGGRGENSAIMRRDSRRLARRSAGRAQLPAAGRTRPDRPDAFRLRRARLRHRSDPSTRGCTIAAAPNMWPRRMPKRSPPPKHLRRTEGIIPALESAHAVAEAIRRAPADAGAGLHRQRSGRGDKDIDIYRENMPELDLSDDAHRQAVPRPEARGRKACIAYLTAGDPTPAQTPALVAALERGGADLMELGVPFSDPIADGPVIQQRGRTRARGGHDADGRAGDCARNSPTSEIPLLLFTYLNPVLRYGFDRLARDAAERRHRWRVCLTDASVEEAARLRARSCAKHGLDTVFLAAPTSTERRLKLVARIFHGFRVFGFANRRNR